VVLADYRTLVDCLTSGEVDLAWMPPIAFVAAADRGAGALVVAERRGRTSYESAIITRADADIATLDDLRGRSIAWVDRESSGGYLAAVALVRRRLGEPGEVFAREYFHGSHRAVCEAVENGWADVGATYVVRTDEGEVSGSGWDDLLGDAAAAIRPIAFAGPIPGDNIAFRPDLPKALREELTALFTGLGDDDAGRSALREVFNADALTPADVTLYEAFRNALPPEREPGG
jgi:phosphate/phosphite/phosphonate ABC transporter binding protein